MSNHTIFDKEYMKKLIEPFAPGMVGHIAPIKYEAVTPDQFLLLFRATKQNGENHFFISFETDLANSLEGAKCTIEDWYGDGVINFWPLAERYERANPGNVEDFRTETRGPYHGFLVEVSHPTFKSY